MMMPVDPVLLTEKSILIQIHNEVLNSMVRNEIDLQMNEVKLLIDIDPKVHNDRMKQVQGLKAIIEDQRKVIDIIQKRFLALDGKDGKPKGKEKN